MLYLWHYKQCIDFVQVSRPSTIWFKSSWGLWSWLWETFTVSFRDSQHKGCYTLPTLVQKLPIVMKICICTRSAMDKYLLISDKSELSSDFSRMKGFENWECFWNISEKLIKIIDVLFCLVGTWYRLWLFWLVVLELILCIMSTIFNVSKTKQQKLQDLNKN